MKRHFSITTRVGDRGMTRTLFGAALSKGDPRIDVCGQVDEVVSALGVARAATSDPALKAELLAIQRDLFRLAAEVSAGVKATRCLKNRLDALAVRSLDARRRQLEKTVAAVRDFILPGETLVGAHLDLARAMVRRCERTVVMLAQRGEFRNRHVLVWLNRLSDVLWLMARKTEGHSRPLHQVSS